MQQSKDYYYFILKKKVTPRYPSNMYMYNECQHTHTQNKHKLYTHTHTVHTYTHCTHIYAHKNTLANTNKGIIIHFVQLVAVI